MNSLQSFNSVANDSWENNPLAPFFKGEYYASFLKTEFANSIIPVPSVPGRKIYALEYGKSLAHSSRNVILLAKRKTDELTKTVSIQTAGTVKQKMTAEDTKERRVGNGREK